MAEKTKPFEMMLADKKWNCRIGRINLKPGASMVCPFPCNNFF